MAQEFDTIILGAGATGLFTARELLNKGGNSVLVLEKNSFVGGIASSFQRNDFIIDFGPHKLFSLLPGVMEEFKSINGEDNLIVKKVNSLFFLGKKFQFPIKPLEMLKNISLRTAYNGAMIPLSLAKSLVRYNLLGKKDETFEDYLVKGFGRRVYNILFEGYAKKVWAHPDELSKDIAEIRIPLPNIGGLLKSTKKEGQVKINASEFYYPKYGMKQFMEKLAESIESKGGEILLNQKVVLIEKKGGMFSIRTDEGAYICKHLVSTIPLESFVDVYSRSPEEIKEVSAGLRYNDLSLVYLFFDKPQVITDNWIFFPEIEYSFNRLSEQKSFSPYTVPAEKTVLCAEITNPEINKLPKEQIVSRAIDDLGKAGIVADAKEISEKLFLRFNKVYPVYDKHYKKNVHRLIHFLDSEGIVSLGRNGLFNYNNIDHCLDMAWTYSTWRLAKGTMEDWQRAREKFAEYRIVD